MVEVTVVPSLTSSGRPPALLVHGAANSSVVWQFWQQELARRGWTSYAVDLRGHGKSPGAVEGASMSDYADDVTALADQLSEMPVVAGWSMGGLVALMVAARGRARAGEGLRRSGAKHTGGGTRRRSCAAPGHLWPRGVRDYQRGSRRTTGNARP